MAVLKFLLGAAVVLAVIGVVLRLTVLDVWRVPTDDPTLAASLAPTLSAGDLVLAWRGTEPGFSALALCADPTEPEGFVAGRLLGERGKTVRLEGNDVLLNGDRGQTDTACDEATFSMRHPDRDEEVTLGCEIERWGSSRHMRGSTRGKNLRRPEEFRVPPGEVFLVSDNRALPYDSRQYGALPRASCKSRIFFRLWGKDGFADATRRFTFIH